MAAAKKECFVVSAIGEEGSPQRLHADWVLEGIIKPTFDEHFKDYKVLRADQMNSPGLIDAQIIDRLLNADLVIADLTFLNPNAFYEIGIRHVVAKPIIHMNLATERIPFDISLYLSLKFSISHPSDLMKARGSLRTMVENVLASGYEVENPVTKARGRVKFDETATPVDKILQTEVANVANRLSELEKFLRVQPSFRRQHREPPAEFIATELDPFDLYGVSSETQAFRFGNVHGNGGIEKTVDLVHSELKNLFPTTQFALSVTQSTQSLAVEFERSLDGREFRDFMAVMTKLRLVLLSRQLR